MFQKKQTISSLHKKKYLRLSLTHRRLQYRKLSLGFILLLVISFVFFNLLPFFTHLTSFAEEFQQDSGKALQYLQTASQNIIDADFTQAQRNLKSSRRIFNNLQHNLGKHIPANHLLTDSPLNSADNIFNAYYHLIDGTQDLISAFKNYAYKKKYYSALNNIKTANDSYQKGITYLASINPVTIPSPYRQQFLASRQLVQQFGSLLDRLTQELPTIRHFLGEDQPQTYLILLQNTAERRATGGFVGAYALARFNDGYLDDLKIIDTYASDGQLFTLVDAPVDIRRYIQHIALRDTNHTPDFPTTAKLAMQLLEQERGPTVDGVIALDDSIASTILNITGAIHDTEHNLDITADNFFETTEFFIETEKDHQYTPKQVLINTIENTIANIKKHKYYQELTKAMLDFAGSKHLQMYFKNSELESLAKNIALSGIFQPPTKHQDFLAIIHTSLSGNKSDHYQELSYRHDTSIAEDGSLIDTLTISQKHTFSDQDIAKITSVNPQFQRNHSSSWQELLSILGAGPNKSLLRIYVPLGSKLLSNKNIDTDSLEVFKYPGYQSFNFTTNLNRGEAREFQISYRLPFHLNTQKADLYTLKVLKQSGLPDISFTKNITTSDKGIFTTDSPAQSAFVNDFNYSGIYQPSLD